VSDRIEMHRGLQIFKELLAIPTPSGHETAMGNHLVARLEALGLEPEMDPAGNVSIRLPGTDPDRPSICYAAHIDEIGATVTRIDNGELHVRRLGGLFPWKIGESPVSILGDHETIGGMLSLGSGHSRTVVERGATWEGARVMTGRSASSLSKAGVRVGSPVVPDRSVCGPFVFGEPKSPWIGAWTFDNRLAVACFLETLERMRDQSLEPRSPTTLAFTVEEEIGCLGAKVFAQRERPDVFIAVDGSPLVPECPVTLDGSPGIRSRDRMAAYDQELLLEILEISSQAGVTMQPVVYEGAASDASAVYSVGASPRVACFGYVRASSHGYEVTPLRTFDQITDSMLALLAAL